MTSRSVNSKKSDSLLAPAAVEKWLRYVDRNSEDLRACASDHGWVADPDSVRRVARHIYRAADVSTGVWSFENGKHRIEPLGDAGKRMVLALLQD